MYAKTRHSTVNAKTLDRLWGVGLETTQKTLRVMMQNEIRVVLHPIMQQY